MKLQILGDENKVLAEINDLTRDELYSAALAMNLGSEKRQNIAKGIKRILDTFKEVNNRQYAQESLQEPATKERRP